LIVVIQCAASKRPGAGHLASASGKPAVFVAQPEAAPADPALVYARPDDPYDTRLSWRQVLLEYNDDATKNPFGLLPAYRLYGNRTYGRLVDRFGVKKVYILSAGWGLIPSDFLTPYYDITFSPSAGEYKRRKQADQYCDFRMLSDQTDENIVFFGGKDYLRLFSSLTNAINSQKLVFYNSARVPQVTGCVLERFETSTRTNWHYECANAFLDGAFTGNR
jgi:hypothetical protein